MKQKIMAAPHIVNDIRCHTYNSVFYCVLPNIRIFIFRFLRVSVRDSIIDGVRLAVLNSVLGSYK